MSEGKNPPASPCVSVGPLWQRGRRRCSRAGDLYDVGRASAGEKLSLLGVSLVFPSPNTIKKRNAVCTMSHGKSGWRKVLRRVWNSNAATLLAVWRGTSSEGEVLPGMWDAPHGASFRFHASSSTLPTSNSSLPTSSSLHSTTSCRTHPCRA
jgi:hypothetical protein